MSRYKINNNKLTKERVNKSTILLGFIGVKNAVYGSIREYLGGGW